RFHEAWDQNDFNAMEDLIERHQHEVAAIIIEPIVQGAGGLWFYHAEYLRKLRQACDAYGLVLIFDEIATGFCRTGELFAMHHADVVPDVLCLGKALTGGMMTMAVTMTTLDIAQTINQSAAGVFMHGPTFMANPLACRVASASIELLLSSSWQARVKAMESVMKSELTLAGELPTVLDVRVLGAIGVIETHEAVDRAKLCAALVKRGVWVRPFHCYVYIMPPYVMNDKDLKYLCQTIVEELSKLPAS
ncbi:MAG: aminotransferase class III-fold pyridoxal phosphate-dependent enzyme, partial [Gammaproteobacteria bacterium]